MPSQSQVRALLLHFHVSKILLTVALTLMAWGGTTEAQGRQFYVAPNGSRSGDGSREHPWDLASALSGSSIPAGSTIWLRGGTYVGVFTSTLAGTEQAPVTVRSFAGERAIINDTRERAGAATINVKGSWTIYRDFEVTNRATGRGASRLFRPMGFEVTGPHNRFINLVIHDAGHGLGVWKEAVDAEIYGNIIFNCGTQNEVVDQGHGHGIYSQNNEGTKSIRENVIFNQFGWGIHVWPGPGDVTRYDVEGNVLFNNGVLSSPTHVDDNLLINSHAPFHAERIRIVNNYTYDFPRSAPGAKFYDAGVCMLCTDPRPQAGGDLVVQGNYLVRGAPNVIIGNWQSVTVSSNSFIGEKGFVAYSGSAHQVMWDQNRYFGEGLQVNGKQHVAFQIADQVVPFQEWRDKTGLDRNSNYSTALPTGLEVFIRPNQYEPGRANIIVYNWKRQDRVQVDLRSILKTGEPYVVLNVQDFLGDPVLSGTFDGKPVTLPMVGLRVAVPVGRSAAPPFTGPEFAVFVVRTAAGKTSSGSPGQTFSTTQPSTGTALRIGESVGKGSDQF